MSDIPTPEVSTTTSGSRVLVEGLNPLIRALKRAEHLDALQVIRDANTDAADAVKRTAEPMVPRRSGRLARTLRSSGAQRYGTVRVGNRRKGRGGVPYAGVIHFGWPKRNISAQPFLYDALARTDVLAIYNRHVDRLVEELNRHEDDDGEGVVIDGT